MISSVAVGAAPASAAAKAGASKLACRRGDPVRAGAATSRGASHAVASSRDAARMSRLIGPPRPWGGGATPGSTQPTGGKTEADGRRGDLAAADVATMPRGRPEPVKVRPGLL